MWYSLIWVKATSKEWEVNKICGQLFGEAVLVWMTLCKAEWVEDVAHNIFFSCPWLKLEQTELLWRIKAWVLDLYLKALSGFLFIKRVFRHHLLAPNLTEGGVVEWLRHSRVAFESLICSQVSCVTFGVLLSLPAPQFPIYFKGALPCFWENCEDKYVKNFCSVWAFLNGAITERGESWSVGRGCNGTKEKPLPRPLCGWEAFDVRTIQVFLQHGFCYC